MMIFVLIDEFIRVLTNAINNVDHKRALLQNFTNKILSIFEYQNNQSNCNIIK